MKIERLKKNHKKQIIIGAVVICIIGGALTFNLTKAKYKLTESIPLVRGTVNYKAYDFKVMAMYKSEDGTNYTEITDRMPNSGYKINESKSYCTLDNKNKDTAVRLYTENGKHIMENLAKSDKCYLYFDKKTTITIGNTEIEYKDETVNFVNVATTDEGVYAISDGMYGGTSYYWRGAVTNNYVKFAGFCWRIIRINGDKSIRLIYDGNTCHANGTSTSDSIAVTRQTYNTNYDRSEYVGWTYSVGNQRTLSGSASNAKSQTDAWYSSNIGNNTNYASKVTDGKYCNDRDTVPGYSWSSQRTSSFQYKGYDRNGEKYSSVVMPSLSCPSGDVYTLKAGAITMDEVIMAGGKMFKDNSNYYLYNNQYYWTMTPSRWSFNSVTNNGIAIVYYVYRDGSLTGNTVALGNTGTDESNIGLRPVINLKSDTKYSSGNGTLSNPYVVQ